MSITFYLLFSIFIKSCFSFLYYYNFLCVAHGIAYVYEMCYRNKFALPCLESKFVQKHLNIHHRPEQTNVTIGRVKVKSTGI